MPPETENTPATGAQPASPAPDLVAEAMASLAAQAPPADVIRQSPEYLGQQEQIRTLARQAGDARRQAELANQQLQASQAAEAQRQAEALQHQLQATLGDRAADFGQIMQLMQTDPVAAAARFSELTRAQSAAGAPAPSVQPVPSTGAPAVPQSQGVPSMQGIGVAASAPLGAPAQLSLDEQAASHIAAFEATVKANRDMQSRTKVRAKERAAAIGNYLQGALMRDHGVKLDTIGFDRDR